MNFFIVGTSRSGSTLLRQMLALHPNVAALNESHWLPRMWERFAGGAVATADLLSILEETHWDTGKRVIDVNLELANRSWDEFLQRLRTALGPQSSVSRFHDSIVDVVFDCDPSATIRGDKTPDYGFYMPMLQQVWPNARFVHITRNGIDTALSMSKHPGCQLMISLGYDNWVPLCHDRAFEKYTRRSLPFAEFVRSWCRRMNRIRRDAGLLERGTYLEVSYESLLSDCERTLRIVGSHLSIDADSTWVRDCERIVRPAAPREALDPRDLASLTPREWREFEELTDGPHAEDRRWPHSD